MLVVLLVCSGCLSGGKPVKTVTYAQLLDAAKPNLHNTLITVAYYCGSMDGFDYFAVYPPLSREERYRVLEADSGVDIRFAFTNDRNQWREWPPFDFSKAIRETFFLWNADSVTNEPPANSLTTGWVWLSIWMKPADLAAAIISNGGHFAWDGWFDPDDPGIVTTVEFRDYDVVLRLHQVGDRIDWMDYYTKED